MHACAGLPLFAGQNLIGALTLDSLAPDQFDAFSDEELRLIAALAAGALNNALLIGQLENQQLAFSASAGLAAGQSGGQTDIIGLSPCMMQLKKEIAIVAGADMNVLVSGETGTGKELVVQSIHELSARRDHPLVYLNCAALPKLLRKVNYSGMSKAHLPVLSATAAANLKWRITVPCFWMRLVSCRRRYRPNCCGSYSMAISSGSVMTGCCG